MMQESLPLPRSTATISLTIIDAETLTVSTQSGDFILNSTEPMSLRYIPLPTNWNGFAVVKLRASPATPPYSPPDTSAGSSSQSWIALPTKSLDLIRTLSSVSVILLCGLSVGGLVLGNFVVPLACLLIVSLVIKSYRLTIPPPSSVNGLTDRL